MGKIENCYSTGQVSANGNPVYKGGLIGDVEVKTDIACFWDTQTSGLDISAGGNGVQGKTTAEMKTLATFTTVGWDFVGETENGYEDFWRLCNEGSEYPKLAWQYLSGDIACPDGVDNFDLAELCEQWLFNEIPADLFPPPAGDGIVNFADFSIFANQWGITTDIVQLLDFTEQWLKIGLPICSADISPLPDGDARVDAADFAVMANDWLEGF